MDFNDEAMRICANLAQIYESWLIAKRELDARDYYMTWKTVNGARYLYSNQTGNEKSMGRESPENEQAYLEHTQVKGELKLAFDRTDTRLKEVMAQYRALRLPQVMTMPAKILSAMDSDGVLGVDFLVVGSAAFPAYEMEACSSFLNGLSETEDFDLCWNPRKAISSASPNIEINLSGGDRSTRSLMEIIQSVDKTFKRSPFSTHKLRNDQAFEVDVLCHIGDQFRAGSVSERAALMGQVEPCELDGQDILRHGMFVRQIVIGRGLIPAPMVVPDPRCMAIHKFWLSKQPNRMPQKRGKDAKQAAILWSACQDKLYRFPIGNEFIDSLPDKWRGIALELKKEVDVDRASRDSALRPK